MVSVLRRRGGLTLIEVLIATVITLLMVFALAETFAYISQAVTVNRATVEMAGQIRGAALRLQTDLEGVTVPMRPWPESGSGLGYFEYFDGPENDFNGARTDSSVGDFDDILMFTSRGTKERFVGRINPLLNGGNPTIDSSVAEIAWWTQPEAGAPTPRFRLHRRQLLVRPDLNNAAGYLPGTNASTFAALQAFQNDNDLSVHRALDTTVSPPVWRIVANSLADLTIRENRFAHLPVAHQPNTVRAGFPHLINNVSLGPPRIGLLAPGHAQSGIHLGEDVVLANLLGFDVRAYDPSVPLRAFTTNVEAGAFLPGDPAYAVAGTAPTGGTGGYVDLNYAARYTMPAGFPGSVFSGSPQRRSQLYLVDPGVANSAIPLPTYDTWSFDYERDGINQDGPITSPSPPDPLSPIEIDLVPGQIDEGTDGFDTPYPTPVGSPPSLQVVTRFGVDDVGERETSPPYPVPLRGIQIRIRIIDPDSRQVRQMTVVREFTPE